MPSEVAERVITVTAPPAARLVPDRRVIRMCKRVDGFVRRWRYPLLLVLAVAIWAVLYSVPSADWSLFVYFGRTTTGQVAGAVSPDFFTGGISRALHMYADMPRTQIGPVALWAAVPLSPLPILVAARVYAGLMMVAGVGVVRLCDGAFPGNRLDPRRQRAVVLGGSVLLVIWSFLAVRWLHLDDVLAIALLVAAVGCARSGRWALTGFFIATAVSAKPWALVAVPLILTLPREKWAKSFLVLVATGVAWWLPFILAAPSSIGALGSVVVGVKPSSVWRLLGLHDLWSPHWLRSVQLAIAVLACAAVARRGRLAAVILVGLWCRVILDPGVYSYYMAGPVTGALLLDFAGNRRWPAFTVASTAVITAATFLPWPEMAALVRLAGGAGIVIAAAAPELGRRVAERFALPRSAEPEVLEQVA